jgi:hypothetical protein
MRKHVAAVAIAAAALTAMSGAAGAVQGPDSKKAFPVECTSGTLVGETLTVVSGKTVYMDDGTQLRLTALRTEFDGQVIEKVFGKNQGTLTCGGSESDTEGTFSFFATLREA